MRVVRIVVVVRTVWVTVRIGASPIWRISVPIRVTPTPIGSETEAETEIKSVARIAVSAKKPVAAEATKAAPVKAVETAAVEIAEISAVAKASGISAAVKAVPATKRAATVKTTTPAAVKTASAMSATLGESGLRCADNRGGECNCDEDA